MSACLRFLQMTYRNETTPNPEVPITEVMAKLQAWWKDHSMSDEEWKSWASNTIVQWTPRQLEEEAGERGQRQRFRIN
jgi:hypothetical protein